MISLAQRISIGTVALTVVMVGAAVGLVWTVARWQAVRALDDELAEHATRLVFMAERGPRPPFRPPPLEHEHDRQRPDAMPPALRAGTGWIFVEMVETDGREGFRSPSLDDPALSLADGLAAAPAGVPVWLTLGERTLRGLRVAAGTATGYVARDATAARAELRRLALTLAGVWGTASLLALLSAWWLRRSVVGPLDRLAAGIRAIDPERLGGRVDANAPREMAETVRLLNALLDRLAAVRERERGTIANIAHELRSPISGLRTTLEVAALTGLEPERALAGRCLPTVVAMHAMVANLLALARIEAGQERIEPAEADADALLDACWAMLAPLAERRNQRLQRSGRAGGVHTGSEHARMVVANLLDNAIAHAPPGSAIHVAARREDGRVWLCIANPLAGAPPDLARLGEPFWRSDAARSAPQHCGLGLALARRIASLLAAELRFTVSDGTFTAHLGLPAAGSEPRTQS